MNGSVGAYAEVQRQPSRLLPPLNQAAAVANASATEKTAPYSFTFPAGVAR